MSYTIGTAAEKLNMSASALRYYDKEGLLPFVHRSAGGIRIFKDSDLERLRLINCLKATHMPIKDIKAFIYSYTEGDATIKRRRDMFYERKLAVEEQMATLQKALDMINYKCWFYDMAVEAGSTEALKSLKDGDIPEEIRRLKENS